MSVSPVSQTSTTSATQLSSGQVGSFSSPMWLYQYQNPSIFSQPSPQQQQYLAFKHQTDMQQQSMNWFAQAMKEMQEATNKLNESVKKSNNYATKPQNNNTKNPRF